MIGIIRNNLGLLRLLSSFNKYIFKWMMFTRFFSDYFDIIHLHVYHLIFRKCWYFFVFGVKGITHWEWMQEISFNCGIHIWCCGKKIPTDWIFHICSISVSKHWIICWIPTSATVFSPVRMPKIYILLSLIVRMTAFNIWKWFISFTSSHFVTSDTNKSCRYKIQSKFHHSRAI